MKVTLIVGGGGDTYYELGLTSGLISAGVKVDFIGSDRMQDSNILREENVIFYNLRRDQNSNAVMKDKIVRILKYYYRLIIYAAKTDSKLFHIQWLNKFQLFDIVFLNLYYKILGKSLIFTAHNVNSKKRDGNDTFINKLLLKLLYKSVDHIIVHTNNMKNQLIEEFNIRKERITVIPYGINDLIYTSNLTRVQSRKKLHLDDNLQVVLFFGNILPYKGLEYLILALAYLKENNNKVILILAGRSKNKPYWARINELINLHCLQDYVNMHIEFIPDKEIEVYCKASDVLILPYKYIFQSGPLFMSYNFGLPVIATDVGSFREDIIEGETGFVCNPEDPNDLAEKIELYFQSDMFKNLETTRINISKYAKEKYSWGKIGEKTYSVYSALS